MKTNTPMHLPTEKERERLPSLGSIDFDFEAILGGISDASTALKKDSLECPECRCRGETSHIRPYQLNFHEAMYLCPNPTCSYPMREDRLLQNFTFKREASSAVDDDKNELYHQASENFADIFNDFNDGFFDNPADLNQGCQDFGQVKFAETNFDSTFSKSKQDIHKVPVSKTNAKSASVEFQVGNTGASQTTVPDRDAKDRDAEFGEMPMDIVNEKAAMEISNINENVQEDMMGGCRVKTRQPEPSPQPSSITISGDAMGVTNTEEHPKDDDFVNTTVLPRVHFRTVMMQWTNSQNSCWLDAILQMTVCSDNIRAAVRVFRSSMSKMWVTLINTYDQSQLALVEPLTLFSTSSKEVDLLSKKMSDVRRTFLTKLQENTNQFKRGEFQSLLEMLPLLLKVEPKLEEMFRVKLLYHFQCSTCLHQRARRSDGLIVSMPNTLGHFHPLNAQFSRRCYECKSENASTSIWMEQLPPCIVFHFQNGLSHSNLRVLDFAFCGQLYCVFAVVQYITNESRHFVTWIRDIKKDRWLRCDDLGKPVCEWTQYQPKIPPHQIHMVFWERRHSESENIDVSALAAICNAEVVTLAESIPIEHFFAHEDETIVIQEEDSAQTAGAQMDSKVGLFTTGTDPNVYYISALPTQCNDIMHSQSQVIDTSQTEVCAQGVFGVTTAVESSTPIYSTGQNRTEHASIMHNLGQNEANNASPRADPSVVLPPTTGVAYKFLQSNPELENPAMAVTANNADRQHIQIIGPQNACNIYIVSQDGQTGQSFYLVPATTPKYIQPSYPTLPSFVDNPHSYNMVADGVGGSLQNQTEKSKGPLKRMRRQFKLSGYSRRNHSTSRYTPMQASKSYSSAKSADATICDAASEKSCNSKGDSETHSEISELSDVLPDHSSKWP